MVNIYSLINFVAITFFQTSYRGPFSVHVNDYDTCMSGINFHYFNLCEYLVLRVLNFANFLCQTS